MAKTSGKIRGNSLAPLSLETSNYIIELNLTNLPKEKIIYYAQLAGIPEGEKIEIQKFSTGYEISLVGNNDIKMTRQIYPDKKEIYNSYFKIFNKQKYSGLKIFKTQVDMAIKEGYKKIGVEAAGYNGSSFNGYYTWLRFGYLPNDDSVTRFFVKRINNDLGTKFTKLEQINKSPEALVWWKLNGSKWYGEFDLTAGSYSRRQLSKYLRDKAKRG